MPIIITITGESQNLDGHEYDYSDNIMYNLLKNQHEVSYSGQLQGFQDHEIHRAVEEGDEFKIYYRKQKNIPFTFLGSTKTVKILEERDIIRFPKGEDAYDNGKLRIHLVVKNAQITQVPENMFTGSGKYKKDIFVHAGLRNVQNESLIPHNRNTNIGFCHY